MINNAPITDKVKKNCICIYIYIKKRYLYIMYIPKTLIVLYDVKGHIYVGVYVSFYVFGSCFFRRSKKMSVF